MSITIRSLSPADDRPNGRRRFRLASVLAVIAVAVPAVLAGGAEARAAVGDPPSWPITDPVAGPPPVPGMPTAGEAPTADVIADPITVGAVCGEWQLRNQYGDRWVAGSTWWEYQCTHRVEEYFPHPCPPVGMCEQVCYGYPFDCFVVSEDRVDHFYWDGSDAVFYGQAYTTRIVDDNGYDQVDAFWWDGPAAGWYTIAARHPLNVSAAGGGSGTVTSTPGGISCGGTCRADYDGGTVVALTATPDSGSIFAGWGGDCWGTGACQVTMDRVRWVTAYFYPDVKELTVLSTQGTGSGTVTSDPAGVSCRVYACAVSFATGTTVTLTATPDTGSTFTGWSGDCTGTGVCQVSMDRNRWASATFTSDVVNQPPTPRFTVSCAALTCDLDGSGSTDSDGTIVTYLWDNGDGTVEGSIGATHQHTYRQAGSYNVALTVVDDGRARATSAPKTVTATNTAPTARFTFTCATLTCSFDGRGSTDDDGTIGYYGWAFGDGSMSAGDTTQHNYASGGNYAVTLTVIDNGGLHDLVEHIVTTSNLEPPPTSTTTTVPPATTTTTTVPPTVPGAPQSVSARPLVREAEVRFTPPSSDGGSPITSYTARCTSSNGGVTRQAQGPTSPVNVRSLSGGKTYTCTVQAINAVGTGPASAPTAPIRVPR